MLIRDLTFYMKGKGSRIGLKDKLNCDADRTVSANPAESSKTTMLFRVLHQVKMTRSLYYHFFQSREADYFRRLQLLERQFSVPEQILKELTAVKCWLSFLQLDRKSSLKEILVGYLYI